MRGSGWLWFAGVVCAGALAHRSQRALDEVRFSRRTEELSLLRPNGPALRVAALGYHTALADAMWVRAVLLFVDVFDGQRSEDVEWLRSTLGAVSDLDPAWRTPYFYGGGFLRVCGDIEGSDVIYARGMAALPADPFFPFSLGMNAYLYRDDASEAFRYLDIAARMPTAPKWYRAAAAAFLDRRGERRAAIRYLEEQLRSETRPQALDALKRKRASLIHDELVDGIARLQEQRAAELGRPVTSLDELGELPVDPLGAGWVLAPDGVVRSAQVDEVMARKARSRGRSMLLRPPGKRQ